MDFVHLLYYETTGWFRTWFFSQNYPDFLEKVYGFQKRVLLLVLTRYYYPITTNQKMSNYLEYITIICFFDPKWDLERATTRRATKCVWLIDGSALDATRSLGVPWPSGCCLILARLFPQPVAFTSGNWLLNDTYIKHSKLKNNILWTSAHNI